MIFVDAARDDMDASGDWHPVGEVSDGHSGSLSSSAPTGRQVYVFGTVDGRVGLFRSTAGFDVEAGHHRAVATAAFELVAGPDDMPYTITVWLPNGHRYTVRFTHV